MNDRLLVFLGEVYAVARYVIKIYEYPHNYISVDRIDIMSNSETGYKWWLRYVVVPLIGGGGIIAVIVALISRSPTEPPLQEGISQLPVTEERVVIAEEIVVDFSAGNAAAAPPYYVAAAPYKNRGTLIK